MHAAKPAGRKTQWGWHCLTEEWADRVVATLGVGRRSLVLDIGAGTGALTGALVRAGAKVIAIELHPGRESALRIRFDGDDVKVVRADAANLYLPRRPFHVVANPPYFLTKPILQRLLAPSSRLISAHIVLQRTNAHRWARGEVRVGRNSRRRFELEVAFGLPRSAFIPLPKVDSSLLVIRRRRRL